MDSVRSALYVCLFCISNSFSCKKRMSLLDNDVDLESIMRSQSVKEEVILENVVCSIL